MLLLVMWIPTAVLEKWDWNNEAELFVHEINGNATSSCKTVKER